MDAYCFLGTLLVLSLALCCVYCAGLDRHLKLKHKKKVNTNGINLARSA